jgi:hypothetical protein
MMMLVFPGGALGDLWSGGVHARTAKVLMRLEELPEARRAMQTLVGRILGFMRVFLPQEEGVKSG